MHWFTNTCSISGAVGNDVHSVDIISDSCAAGVLNVNKVSANNINSDKFRFQYTAFTFGTTHSDSLVATLECTIKICIKGRYIIFIDHFSYFSHQEYKFFIKNFKYLKIVYSSILKKKILIKRSQQIVAVQIILQTDNYVQYKLGSCLSNLGKGYCNKNYTNNYQAHTVQIISL